MAEGDWVRDLSWLRISRCDFSSWKHFHENILTLTPPSCVCGCAGAALAERSCIKHGEISMHTAIFLCVCGIFLTYCTCHTLDEKDSPTENSLPGLCPPCRIGDSIHFSRSQHYGCSWSIIPSSHTLRSPRWTLLLPLKIPWYMSTVHCFTGQ